MRISMMKEFTFHASHHDEAAPENDPCGRVHGHTYKVEVCVTGPLNERGMVIHGNELKHIYKMWIEPWVEHQDLNQTMVFLPAYCGDLGKVCEEPSNPTMEYLAMRLLWAFKAGLWERGASEKLKVSLRLWETPTMSCEIYDGGFAPEKA